MYKNLHFLGAQMPKYLLTKMLTNVSQHNFTRLKYLKQHIKPHPNPPWEKPCFRVNSKWPPLLNQ